MLDVKDLKILKELDIDPRILTTKLAKKIRLSQQVVDYRIRRLMDKGIISGFGTVFNFAKINYSQYRVLFTFSSIDQTKRKEVIDYLRNHNNVYWVALVGSKWDLFVVLFVKNFDEFERFLDVLFNKFSNELSDYDALYVPYHEFYGHKFLDQKNTSVIRINFSEKGTVILDELDSRILKQVRNNCRFSNLEIGNKCGVSYKTVQNRIKNLESNGFICGYRLFLKSEMLGYTAYLLLFTFTSYGRDIEKKLFNYVRSHQLITQVSKTFGGWSLMLHARTKNRRELQDLLIE
ncbi:Lrp/AsnC family transcriptional regulator, partial [archaeon]|nr:Lrp/AsnC family transcriptional regulator [archaeon]